MGLAHLNGNSVTAGSRRLGLCTTLLTSDRLTFSKSCKFLWIDLFFDLYKWKISGFFFNKGIFDILLGFPSVYEGCLNSDKLKYLNKMGNKGSEFKQ